MPRGNGDTLSKLGRGDKAVADMKARIESMKSQGKDGKEILESLWNRNLQALSGEGYTYEYAEE